MYIPTEPIDEHEEAAGVCRRAELGEVVTRESWKLALRLGEVDPPEARVCVYEQDGILESRPLTVDVRDGEVELGRRVHVEIGLAGCLGVWKW